MGATVQAPKGPIAEMSWSLPALALVSKKLLLIQA
jgi:hypothetical protein